jgi:hypothetical protein
VGATVIAWDVVSWRMTHPDIYVVGKDMANGTFVDSCLLETFSLFQ